MQSGKTKKMAVVIGCGRMAGPIVDYFLDQCDFRVTAADRVKESAVRVVRNRPAGIAVGLDVKNAAALDKVVGEAAIVISMLPRPLHGHVARSCLRNRKSMLTTSYEPPEVTELADEAEKKGILFLNEMGEDPGLDHLGTQLVLDEIRRQGGRVTELNSYGCNIPSFQHNNNPFGYKFSWYPRGLFTAGTTAAAYYKDGNRLEVPGDRLFEHFRLVDIDGLGTFETYPNRDCQAYLKPFGLDYGNVTYYRGLLRYPGYCNNMRYLKEIGLTRSDRQENFTGQTYRQFIASLINITALTDLEEQVARFLKLEVNADFIHRLKWLGCFDDRFIKLERGTRLDVLLELMLEKMSYQPHEQDMVIVHIDVSAELADGKRQRRSATLFAEGIPNGDSAISRAVGLPVAIAARLILEKRLEAVGAHIPPTLPQIYPLLLGELELFGLFFTQRIKGAE